MWVTFSYSLQNLSYKKLFCSPATYVICKLFNVFGAHFETERLFRIIKMAIHCYCTHAGFTCHKKNFMPVKSLWKIDIFIYNKICKQWNTDNFFSRLICWMGSNIVKDTSTKKHMQKNFKIIREINELKTIICSYLFRQDYKLMRFKLLLYCFTRSVFISH